MKLPVVYLLRENMSARIAERIRNGAGAAQDFCNVTMIDVGKMPARKMMVLLRAHYRKLHFLLFILAHDK